MIVEDGSNMTMVVIYTFHFLSLKFHKNQFSLFGDRARR